MMKRVRSGAEGNEEDGEDGGGVERAVMLLRLMPVRVELEEVVVVLSDLAVWLDIGGTAGKTGLSGPPFCFLEIQGTQGIQIGQSSGSISLSFAYRLLPLAAPASTSRLLLLSSAGLAGPFFSPGNKSQFMISEQYSGIGGRIGSSGLTSVSDRAVIGSLDVAGPLFSTGNGQS